MTPARDQPASRRELIPLAVNRTPFFCSGCPHNWGTKVPDGTLVGAGTGCHGMSLLMDPDLVGETIGITAMGNEGGQWIGMAPFVETDHIVSNFGDGTYFHSGQLALQAAIGSGVSVTFKILYNDTVAMTGGQDAPHRVAVPELVTILLAHGVAKVMITTDDLENYDRSRLAGRRRGVGPDADSRGSDSIGQGHRCHRPHPRPGMRGPSCAGPASGAGHRRRRRGSSSTTGSARAAATAAT